MLEGGSSVLVRNGQIDQRALSRESLTREELMDVIHRQGFETLDKVSRCELEPNGVFYVEAVEPSSADKHHAELLARFDSMTAEMAGLRARLASQPAQNL